MTWRLHGTHPGSRIPGGKNPKVTTGEQFRELDRSHDRATSGPLWLNDTREARSVCEEIERAANQRGHYVLHEYVVMPNHVHVLVYPKIEFAEFMRQLKGRTAAEANRILHREGKPFWQSESFDHWCRSVAEMNKVRRYIVMNPVSARLAKRPEDWLWSSAHRDLARKRGDLVDEIAG